MTAIKNLFKKPIDRYIEGVVKADDDSQLLQEVEEYVLTNKVSQHVESFLEAYTNFEGANGAWISGFFGSGKSHLLKMLSMVLENRSLDGKSTLDLFLEKCDENPILKGHFQKAADIPSRSILFNIDQKAAVISKTEFDALLAVFVKVFDEHCGYDDMQPYIAQFERDLDSDGLLDAFKSTIESETGKTWKNIRTRVLRYAGQIDAAFNQVTEASATNVIDKYRADYKLSIEDFANNVKAYIDQQEPGFRLNFFVDEVGQYIAEHRKLMVNLQTVAESLATKCEGRSWIIVTSQQDMDSVIGDVNKNQGSDFSKIIARFRTAMPLTSADVATVINERLLAKTPEAKQELADLYNQQKNNLRTLFDFTGGGKSFRNYSDEAHFVAAYPFVPYQYELFQLAIQQLSAHNAFEGKHQSVGERSMLAVFKEVAERVAGNDVGALAPFDKMFDGIRNSIKATIQSSINLADNQLDSELAKRVLKALFLVKYLPKDFHASVHNLSFLLRERFDQNAKQLQDDIQEALDLLEQQTYIQRNGDVYEFLTDEEKDIEQEIKNTDVPTQDVVSELSDLVFDRILRDPKIVYQKNNQAYRYTRKIDGKSQGREYDLAINVITPMNDDFANIATVTMRSMGLGELVVVLPADDRLFREITLYKKTDRYIRHNTSRNQNASTTLILQGKADQNRQRRESIQERLEKLLGQADQYVDASKLEHTSADVRSRITAGFNDLIARTYPSLSMLRDVELTESRIEHYAENAGGGMFGDSLSEMEQEVMAHIQSNRQEGVRSTVKILLEHFQKKPYGWWDWATLCILAMLYSRGKVEVRRDSTQLEGSELVSALRNTQQHTQLIVEPQVEFESSQLRNLKQFANDFFDTPFSGTDARALGQEISGAMTKLVADIEAHRKLVENYPFVANLDTPLAELKQHANKPYAHYFQSIPPIEAQLLDWKEDVLDPIDNFMNGDRKQIFDDSQRLIREESDNFAHLNGDEVGRLMGIITAAKPYEGNAMQEAKNLYDAIKRQIGEVLKSERTSCQAKLVELRGKLETECQRVGLEGAAMSEALSRLSSVEQRVAETTHIATIREAVSTFETFGYPQLVTAINDKAKGTEETDGGIKKPPAQTLSVKQVSPAYDGSVLSSEEDINEYVEALKKELVEALKEGKRLVV